MNYLSFQQTYRLLIFEHCLGEIIYLFIVVPWVLFIKGEGERGERKVLCQVLGKSDVRSSLLKYFL